MADWWLLAEAPDGLYWYTLSGGWVKSPIPVQAYGGALFDLSPMTVLDMSNLPTGNYSFNFGVDTNANGSLDLDALFVDAVGVTIQ